MVKEIFCAGNTPVGFVSFFDKYLDRDRVVCLKGGSGVGKSTLLRSVIARAEAKNYNVIAAPCSSDARSLDMVVVKELDFAVLDATYPHVVEPTAYGLIGEIFNLGDFIDIKKLRQRKEVILQLMERKRIAYNCLYNDMNSAKNHLDNIDNIYATYCEESKIKAVAKEIIEKIRDKVAPAADEIACFASFLDSEGIVDRTLSLVASRTIIKIDCPSLALARRALREIINYLRVEKVTFEPYHSLISPSEIESVGTKNIFITTANVDADWTYSVGEARNSERIRGKLSQIFDERSAVNSEIARASERLSEARAIHGEVEKYYYDAMDFARLEEAKERLIDSLFG